MATERQGGAHADTIEHDGQDPPVSQIRLSEEEIARRGRDLHEREAAIERFRSESELQRAELLNAAKAEARQILQAAYARSAQEISEAESQAAQLLEQARHQATELTNAARAEVEQTLEWARAQAEAIINRAQDGAEQLLAAAGLGDETAREARERAAGPVSGSPPPRPSADSGG